MKRTSKVVLQMFVLLFCFMVSVTFAQGRRDKPSGNEIAAKAKGVAFETTDTATAEFQGKKFKFTPAKLKGNLTRADAEGGVIVGNVDNEFTDISMPQGKFNIFMAKVNNEWKAYAAQADGTIVAEAKSIAENSENGPAKPRAWRGSGCWWLWLIFTGVQVCW